MEPSHRSVAVITGANRGLGYEVARQLAMRDVHVVLTARDERKGRIAAAQLAGQGLPVEFHALDIEDRHSIQRLRAFLQARHGRIDVLINNAGAHPKGEGAGITVAASTMAIVRR